MATPIGITAVENFTALGGGGTIARAKIQNQDYLQNRVNVTLT